MQRAEVVLGVLRENGVDHWRATCIERCPRGSAGSRAEKDLIQAPRRAAYPVLPWETASSSLDRRSTTTVGAIYLADCVLHLGSHRKAGELLHHPRNWIATMQPEPVLQGMIATVEILHAWLTGDWPTAQRHAEGQVASRYAPPTRRGPLSQREHGDGSAASDG